MKCHLLFVDFFYFGLCRRQLSPLEEGDAGTLHPVYQVGCQLWITFMAQLGKCYFFCWMWGQTDFNLLAFNDSGIFL